MLETYPAGHYTEQIGITVKYNPGFIDKENCKKLLALGLYRVKSIAIQAHNREGFPFGTFVATPDPNLPLQYSPNQRHFYYDGESTPSGWNIGDKDRKCQDYTGPTAGKSCTCMDGNIKEPRRVPGFNNDKHYPPLEIVKCPFTTANPDPSHNPVSYNK